MKRLLALLSLSLTNAALMAQPGVFQHPALKYDPVAKTYSFEVPATPEDNLPAQRAVWPSKTQIEPRVTVSVSGEHGNEWTYRYTISNGNGSRQAIPWFRLGPIDAISGITAEPGLRLGQMPPPLFDTHLKNLGREEQQVAQKDRAQRYAAANTRFLRQVAESVKTKPSYWVSAIGFVEERVGAGRACQS